MSFDSIGETTTVTMASTASLALQLVKLPPGRYTIRWAMEGYESTSAFGVTVLPVDEAGGMAALLEDVKERVDHSIGCMLSNIVAEYPPFTRDLTRQLVDAVRWGQWLHSRHLAAGAYWCLGRDIDAILECVSEARSWEPEQWLVALAAVRAPRCSCCGDVPRWVNEAAYMSRVCLAILPIGD